MWRGAANYSHKYNHFYNHHIQYQQQQQQCGASNTCLTCQKIHLILWQHNTTQHTHINRSISQWVQEYPYNKNQLENNRLTNIDPRQLCWQYCCNKQQTTITSSSDNIYIVSWYHGTSFTKKSSSHPCIICIHSVSVGIKMERRKLVHGRRDIQLVSSSYTCAFIKKIVIAIHRISSHSRETMTYNYTSITPHHPDPIIRRAIPPTTRVHYNH